MSAMPGELNPGIVFAECLMRSRLILIDANSICFRVYFGIKANLTSDTGEPTFMLVGYVRSIKNLWLDLNISENDYCIVCFDSPKKYLLKRRINSSYKANRGETPEQDIISQIKLCRDITRLMGLKTKSIKGYEADDLIASYACRSDRPVVVVSCDKDFMQMIGEKVSMWHPFDRRFITEADVIKRWGVRPDLVLEVMSLCGDSTDNVPGIKGVAEKTAAKIIEHSQTAMKAPLCKTLPPKLLKFVVGKQTLIAHTRLLVQLMESAPVVFSKKKCRCPCNLMSTEVRTELHRLGFFTMLKKG